MTRIDEIGPDLFRLSTFVPEIDMQFNQFLVRDEEPLLFHTGLKAHFQSTFEAIKKVIRPDTLRWIAFSHFEADECGALAEWQQVAPVSTAACSVVAKMVSVDDSAALRSSKGLMDGDLIKTGRYRFRWIQTPHVPPLLGSRAPLRGNQQNPVLFRSVPSQRRRGGDDVSRCRWPIQGQVTQRTRQSLCALHPMDHEDRTDTQAPGCLATVDVRGHARIELHRRRRDIGE